MKKITISGSVALQEKIGMWLEILERKGYAILDYPRAIKEESFIEHYPDIHKDFFKNINKSDVLFIMNEDKKNIEGYIGAETFAELTFGMMQNLLYGKEIQIILLKMPSKEVQCYEEIALWLKLGWIRLYEEGVL